MTQTKMLHDTHTFSTKVLNVLYYSTSNSYASGTLHLPHFQGVPEIDWFVNFYQFTALSYLMPEFGNVCLFKNNAICPTSYCSF